MTHDQFAALAKLTRSPSGPAQDAARLVLCDQMRPADAARATGAAPASVSNAVTRIRASLEMARVAAGS
jgi:hypothetical protein